ncbi:DE-cadherin-like isoform X1 [Anopheles merus]|uniref:DE-cadherin-like isoform X1 n=1 Tax=Anopheles merus TaxID=30066 RepID=UPI001BE46D9B|nr:DE-cadherin-like isoform X1 [Anopheles merus]XP_041772888.1 DE-cadherin-like isoform X1 [Anopheles merus]
MKPFKLIVIFMIVSFCINAHAANIQAKNEAENDTISLTVDSIYIPLFTKIPSAPIALNETYDQFNTAIAELEANTNLNDGTNIIFDLVLDNDAIPNIQNTFILEQVNNTAYIKLGGKLDYEKVQEYRITVRAMNVKGLKAEAVVLIKILDENDNIPEITGNLNGVILEHEPAGTFVMQVKAHDNDGTSSHNIVSYRLEGTARQYFHIDSKTGNITSLVEFDREAKDIYPVTVIVEDNSPSVLFNNGKPNSAVKQLFIRVLDKNDHPPRFDEQYYEVNNIPEDADINTSVIKVKAMDMDKDPKIKYSIIENNIGKAFKIDEDTGLISVNKKLDYESIQEYDLVVQAYDGRFKSTTNVWIQIKNLNDIAPQILTLTNVTIKENTIPLDCIANLWAYDPDIENFEYPQNIQYALPKEHQHLLSIDDKGCLKLLQPLDRDPPHGQEVIQINITITDENGKGRTVMETVYIFVEDINDNAPQLTNRMPVVWSENRPSAMITKLTAKDADGEHNGPPFFYSVDPDAPTEIKNRFQTVGDELYSLVEFDREQQKQYLVPILIRDSGHKPMSAVSKLLVVIGDKNDNEMQMGQSHILVNNYEGKLADTQLGRVYVSDPDDWDVSDKMFLWDEMTPETNRKLFKLNFNTGMITMIKGTPEGIYNLAFTVIEESSYFPRHNVSVRVTVTVKNISAKTVNQSGSIRFYNVTAETFISQTLGELNTPMYRLQQSIASILDTSPDQVDIFTINNRKLARGAFLDVFFTVDDTIYTSSEVLNAVLSLHLRQLEEDVGYRIVTVGIDECIEKGHTCTQTCKNKVLKTAKPIVVNTNTSSFVGMTTLVQAQCIPQIESSLVACFNGGTFQNGKCNCPMGFEGSLCEKLDICFDGSGYAIYPSINSGNVNNISIELLPRHKDGLVFYMGPLKYDPSLKTSPFLALEINDGMLVLLLDYGTGTSRFEHQQIVLHEIIKVQVILQPYRIEIKTVTNKMVSSRSHYENKDWSGFLTGNVSLQLGVSSISLDKLGSLYSWKYVPFTKSFDGCLRNLTINGRTIDFTQTSQKHNILFISQGFTAIGEQILLVSIVTSSIAIMAMSIVIVIRLKDYLQSWIEILIRKLQTKSIDTMVELHPAPEQLPSFTEVDERCVGLLSGMSTH